MASVAAGTGAVLRQLGRLFGAGTVAGLGEAELLGRFVRERDEAAFAVLVERHGPMVWAVCRRVLGEAHAAEDAFQATFLVLVRRAASIRDGDRLGPWLHGVAHRVALRARAQRNRRRDRERGGDLMSAHEPADKPAAHGDDHPVGPALDAELARLPRAYRDVVVLCDLEGRTHEEAARMLRWPVGTVKGRLHRARERLRDRLVRRGVVLPAGAAAMAAVLADEARCATVPPALLDATVRAATGLAAGGTIGAAGLASASAIGLADGAIHAMFWTNVKLAASAVVAGTLVASSGTWAYQDLVAQGPGPARAKTAKVPLKTSDLAQDAAAPVDADSRRQVEQAREKFVAAKRALALEPYESALAQIGNGGTEKEVYEASLRILAGEPRPSPAEPPAPQSFEAHRDRMKKLEDAVKKYHQATGGGMPGAGMGAMMSGGGEMSMMMGGGAVGTGPAAIPNPTRAAYYLAEAELWVAEVKAGQSPSGYDPSLGAPGLTVAGADPFGGANRFEPSPAASAPAATLLPGAAPPPASSPSAPLLPSAAPPAVGVPSGALLPAANAAPAPGLPGGLPPEPGVPDAVQPASADPFAGGGGRGLPAPMPATEEVRVVDARNRAILAALDRAVDVEFREPTPLGDVLEFFQDVTRGPELSDGVPIYLDPAGVVEQIEKALESGKVDVGGGEVPGTAHALEDLRSRQVSLKLKGVPLKTTLRLLLKQAGLGYFVKDGLVFIGVPDTAAFRNELNTGRPVEGYGEVQAGSPLLPRVPGGFQ